MARRPQSPKRSSASCPPRWATRRTPERKTIGPRVGAVASLFGLPFMPWQQQVADVAGELIPGTNMLAYRQVVVLIPRQSGKTTLSLAEEVDRAINWGKPQTIAYTAQTGKDARSKLVIDQGQVLSKSALQVPFGIRVYGGVGAEAITFNNGSRIGIIYSGPAGGHGKTLDLGVIDEAFDDVDDEREQAMAPAMITRPDAQLWIVSTAGDERSVYLMHKRDAGRDSVENSENQNTCYFEWSAPIDAPYDDPATWRSCMPAMGRTVREQDVQAELAMRTEGTFRRMYLNQWWGGEDRVIPAALWNAANDE